MVRRSACSGGVLEHPASNSKIATIVKNRRIAFSHQTPLEA
jgi:hypothetical protein